MTIDMTEHDKQYGGKLTRTLGSVVYKSILLDSGIFGLNLAHGIGGIRTGSVVQIMGAKGLGKSSIAYRILANGIKAGMSAMIVDSEAGINEPVLMDTLEDYGVDLADPVALPLRYATATNLREVKWEKGRPVQSSERPILTLERSLPLIEDWIISEKTSPNGAIIVIDSLDMLPSDVMIGSKVDDATVALVAKRMKHWLRMFAGTIRGTGSMVIVVHQSSTAIGGMGYDDETFTGGKAIGHIAHVAIRLKDFAQKKDGDELVGRTVKGTITKSKQGLAWRTFSYDIRSDCGPDNVGAVFDAAKKMGLIKGTAWVELPDWPKPLNGREAVRQHWYENPEHLRHIENLIMNAGKLDELAPKEEEVDDG